MKPINEWTQEEKNEFLRLFTENSKYEWDARNEVCKKCKTHHFSGFVITKSFMEKEWPQLWKKYLDNLCLMTGKISVFIQDYSISKWLDLANLIAFLLEPEQVEKWGWVECMSKGIDEGTEYRMCTVDLKDQKSCNFCDRRIKHPALIYADGINKMQVAQIKEE